MKIDEHLIVGLMMFGLVAVIAIIIGVYLEDLIDIIYNIRDQFEHFIGN